MAFGKGAAFGVDLWTKAEAELTDEPHVIKTEITSEPKENTALIEKTAIRVLKRLGLENSFGVKVKTFSNIPIAKGFKSSSAAANAVALAATAALDKTLNDLEIVNLGVDAAFDAKVTVTGAFDDACASYFGDIVITDNLNREIVKKLPLDEVAATLCPAAIVTGRLNPVIENSEFDDWSEEMVTAAFEAVSVACRLALDPTVTLPKLRLAGLTANCALAGATPVPVKDLAVGEFVALLVNPAWPDAAPEAFGLN